MFREVWRKGVCGNRVSSKFRDIYPYRAPDVLGAPSEEQQQDRFFFSGFLPDNAQMASLIALMVCTMRRLQS